MFENIRTLFQRKSQPINVFSRRTPGMPIYTEMSVQKATREGYQLSIYVYRAIRSIIQSISGIPWIVLDKNGEQIPNHDFEKTWAHPNKEFSGQDNMEYLIAHLKLVGNAFVQPLMVNGRPKEFWVCLPDLIKPIPSKTPGTWLDGYQVTLPGGGTQIQPIEQFIHFMQFNPGDPYWGIGDLQAAARTIDTDNEAMDTQKVSMQNRGTPDGVFVNESISNQEQFDEAKRQIKEQYLPKDNRRAPWVIGGNTKWYQMSLTPVEMDYIKSRIYNKRDIAAAFGLDPWWLGDRENSTYNNVQEARKALYEDVGIPLLDDIKATLNLKVAPLYGEDITIAYDLSNIKALRDDYGKKTEQAHTLWSMGIPFEQINDKLEMGFEEFDGWDRGYLPFSVAPVGAGGETEQPEPETEETPTEESEEEPIKSKADMPEDMKTQYWKRIDSRRVAYWSLVEKRVRPLYLNLGTAISENPDSLNSVIKKESPKWQKTLKAIDQVLIEDFGNQTANRLKSMSYKFDPFTTAIRAWIRAHAAESVTTILDTQKEAMADLIAKGVEDNLTNVQIAKSIRSFYEDNARMLAMRVARTEVSMAAGYGQSESAKQSGANRRRWLSSRDERVRDTAIASHVAMDGESVGINESYSNGMAYVGDPAGGPENVINCRCVEQFFKE